MQHEMWLGDLGVLLNFFSSYKQFLTTLSLLAEKKNQNPSFLIVSRKLQGSIEWYQINENVLGILIFKNNEVDPYICQKISACLVKYIMLIMKMNKFWRHKTYYGMNSKNQWKYFTANSKTVVYQDHFFTDYVWILIC